MKRFSKPMGIIIAFVFYNLVTANDELKYPDKRATLLCDNNVERCGWNNWEQWDKCEGHCESGTRYRVRGLCCIKGQNFTECALACNYTLEEAVHNSSNSESCIVCKNGGVYDSYNQRCTCPKDYNGACCDNAPSVTTDNTPTPTFNLTSTKEAFNFASTTEAPHVTTDNNCDDKLLNDQCFNYNDDNCYGIYVPWAKENCPLRCGFCENKQPPCVDQIPNCNLYAKSDCIKYDKWGRYTCRKFCDRCVPPTQALNLTTTKQECVDKLSNCSIYNEISCFGIFEPWAREHCERTCGFCTGSVADCVDYHRDCEHLPNVCTIPTYREFASTMCRRYCNLC